MTQGLNGDLDAAHYRKNSSIQFHLAEDVLKLHAFKGDESVLDIGCGDGRLTQVIQDKVPFGQVTGIDPSLSMVRLAQASFPGIIFERAGAENYSYPKTYDLITSFSAFHWVRGQEGALKKIAGALKPSGRVMILTFPKESPYFALLEEVLLRGKWKPQVSACSSWLTFERYRRVIHEVGFKPIFLKKIRENALYESREAFKNYVKGWLKCLVTLSDLEEAAFLDELADRAISLYGNLKSNSFEIPYDKVILYLEK